MTFPRIVQLLVVWCSLTSPARAGEIARTVLEPSPGDRERPVAASDGSQVLVAWVDGMPRYGLRAGPSEVVVARLGADHRPTETLRFLVDASPNRVVPQLVSCGSHWLLATSANGPGPVPLEVVRLSTAGGLRADSARLRIADGASRVRVACGGSVATIVWGDAGGGYLAEIHAARLDLDADPPEAVPLPSPTLPDRARIIEIPFAFDGGVGFTSGGPDGIFALHVARFDPEPRVEAPVRLVAFGDSWPALSATQQHDGTILAVWKDPGDLSFSGLRIRDGARLDPEPFEVARIGKGALYLDDLQPVEGGFSLLLRDPDRFLGVHVPLAGPPTPEVAFARGDDSVIVLYIARATAGARSVAVWTEISKEQGSIRRTVMTGEAPAGGRTRPALDPALVSISANAQLDPAVASRGSEHLAVWVDTREGRQEVHGAWISAGGVPLGEDFLIGATGVSPSVVAGGTGYLVSWYGRHGDHSAGTFARMLTPGQAPGGEVRALGERYVGAAWDPSSRRFVLLSQTRLWSWPEGGLPEIVQTRAPSHSLWDVPEMVCDQGRCGAVLTTFERQASSLLGASLEREVETWPLVSVLRTGDRPPTSLLGAERLAWLEPTGDDTSLRIASLRGWRALGEPASVPLPGDCYRSLQAFERDGIAFVGARPMEGRGQVLAVDLRGGSPAVVGLQRASQFAIAEDPSGGYVVAWTEFDEAAGSNRIRVARWQDLPAPATLPPPCAP